MGTHQSHTNQRVNLQGRNSIQFPEAMNDDSDKYFEQNYTSSKIYQPGNAKELDHKNLETIDRLNRNLTTIQEVSNENSKISSFGHSSIKKKKERETNSNFESVSPLFEHQQDLQIQKGKINSQIIQKAKRYSFNEVNNSIPIIQIINDEDISQKQQKRQSTNTLTDIIEGNAFLKIEPIDEISTFQQCLSLEKTFQKLQSQKWKGKGHKDRQIYSNIEEVSIIEQASIVREVKSQMPYSTGKLGPRSEISQPQKLIYF